MFLWFEKEERIGIREQEEHKDGVFWGWCGSGIDGEREGRSGGVWSNSMVAIEEEGGNKMVKNIFSREILRRRVYTRSGGRMDKGSFIQYFISLGALCIFLYAC